MRQQRILQIERPDTEATVGFLSEGVLVKLSVENGKICINVKCSHGESASTWDEHDVEWPLPERQDDDEEQIDGN